MTDTPGIRSEVGPMPDLGAITDVPGIRVGQVTSIGDGWLTGVTVVLPDPGTVAGVDVRGGGPGTHETDALDPRTLVNTVDAVVLTGGSAFGLVTAHGAQRFCHELGRGVPVSEKPGEVVPIVPAAAVFDLGRGGEFLAHPSEQMGYDAAQLAHRSGEHAPVERGVVGAGTGSALGRAFKGGVGTASITLDGDNSEVIVGAIVIVNARGLPWLPGHPAPSVEPVVDGTALNTTIAIVATNAVLDSAEASRTATVAHDGFARALNPVHTLSDGDTIFALATGRVELAGDARLPGERHVRVESLVQLQTAAAEAIRLATLDGIRSAHSVTTPAIDLPRYPFPEDLDWSIVR